MDNQTYSFYVLYRRSGAQTLYFYINAHKLTDTSKQPLIRAIEENEDVLFQWCIMTAEFETKNKNAALLLHMIVELYISYTSWFFFCCLIY